MSLFTVITPVQYYGQKETDPYIRASILLDGADQPITGVDIRDIPSDRVPGGHARSELSGSRLPTGTSVTSATGTAAWEGVIERWEPTGSRTSIPDRCRSSRFDACPRRRGRRDLADELIPAIRRLRAQAHHALRERCVGAHRA